MYRWHIQPGIYRIRDATVGEELISGHFQGNSVVEVRADGNCVTFTGLPIVHAEVVSVDETTAVFLPYPAEDVGAGDVGGKGGNLRRHGTGLLPIFLVLPGRYG